MNEWSRMWARASFAAVLIVIGVPLWWKTTEVYRVALPYSEISSFNSLDHKVSTVLVVHAIDAGTAQEIAARVEEAFHNNDILSLRVKQQVHSATKNLNAKGISLEDVSKTFDLATHNFLHALQDENLSSDVRLGNERILYFKNSSAVSTLIQVLDKWIYQTEVLRGARSITPDLARRTRFPPSDRYHIVLSVVHPKPGELKVEFNVSQVMKDYIGSFVDELSILHNFTLKSQWLHFLEFDFKATKVRDVDGGGWHHAARRDRLHALLTQLEGRAAVRLAGAAPVSLALYLVPCELSPLLVYADDDDYTTSPVSAFASPRWGGVALASPPPDVCKDPTAPWTPDAKPLMGIFIAQLRMLLGFVDYATIPGAYLEQLDSVSPRLWEVDALLRLRCLEQITTAERTLQSLAQLLGEISNIVINDKVGAAISTAVNSIRSASELVEHDAVAEAYAASQAAHVAAETAFTDPSLLALLYFPNDQKYAIYIPLFLPVMLPVVLSLKNLFLWFRGKKLPKEKTD